MPSSGLLATKPALAICLGPVLCHACPHLHFFMAKRLDDNELVSFKELLMANSIQVDAAIQLLIKKGFFTQDEFFTK